MTSSITPITAASNSDTTAISERPPRGLAALRDTESKALIHLGMDALSEAHTVGHDLHQVIYGRDQVPGARLQDRLAEVLACMETAEHYLRMLGSVLDETSAPAGAVDPWRADPAF